MTTEKAADGGMFGAADKIPDMLQNVLKPGPGVVIPDPANVILSRLTLSYWENDARCKALEVAFQGRQGEHMG